MRGSKIPLWRDIRFWRVAGQGAVLLMIGAIALALWNNLTRNLQQLGIQLGFGFLESQAAFDIGETAIAYQPADPYSRVLLVGLVNSLRVMVAGIVLATGVGVTAGIARLSDNWLVRQLAMVYVETIRNTPLLLQLFFWYFAVFLRLPPVESGLALPGSIYLTNRGVALPWPQITASTGVWAMVLLLGAMVACGIWRWRNAISRQGQPGQPVLWAGAAIALTFAMAWAITGGGPWNWQVPQVVNTQIRGGVQLSPEFSTLLIGLTVYTGAFIAEIVRAGIQAVPQGQWEAARSLGLKPGLMMRLVIFPQALRVIVPPLTSQYLNLAKNSSLALAVGYPDFYAVSSTTFNQTGRAIEVMLLLMVTYLTISLIIAIAMNLYNRTVQLKER